MEILKGIKKMFKNLIIAMIIFSIIVSISELMGIIIPTSMCCLCGVIIGLLVSLYSK